MRLGSVTLRWGGITVNREECHGDPALDVEFAPIPHNGRPSIMGNSSQC
jgi:starvation-inducible outer membrane lipoprotein